MRIAIFTDTFLPNTNGVVTSILNHIKELSRRGHKVLLLTLGKSNERYNLDKNIRVVKYRGVTIPTYKDYQVRIPKYQQTHKELIKFKPDVIHVQTPFTMGWDAVINSKKMGIPLVGTHHTFFSDYTKHLFLIDLKIARKFSDKYIKAFFNKCDLVTSPSKSLLEELRKIGVKTRIIKIPNGVNIGKIKMKTDIKRKYGLKKTVLYMGRVSYEKSIDVVLKSMKKVQEKIPEAKLLIVGEGPDLKKLKRLSRKLKIEPIFTGIKRGQDLIDYIYAGDVFVTASKSENQPMSILEVMSCKKSLVGVDSRGVPELIQHNKNGLIAKPDDIRDIARKIIRLLNNKKLREKFEKASLREVKEYSIKKVTDKWEKQYHELKNSKNHLIMQHST
ncbi:MAG: glycosyltransferase [Nanoarchaeota archaeon]|nr:glycosyltransferase [Nanoarchaeota archaeon]